MAFGHCGARRVVRVNRPTRGRPLATKSGGTASTHLARSVRGNDRGGASVERILSSELSQHVGERVRLAGWLHNQRQLSALTFVVLRDRAGIARPEDAFYVGDALDDMRMAAAAGVRGIGIVSMNTTADDPVSYTHMTLTTNRE